MVDVDNDSKKDVTQNYSHVFYSNFEVAPYADIDDENGDTVNYDSDIGGTDLTDTEDPDSNDSSYTHITGGDENDMEANHITSGSPYYLLMPTISTDGAGNVVGKGSVFFDTANINVLLKFAGVEDPSSIQYYVDIKNGAYVQIDSPTKTYIGNLSGSKINIDSGGYLKIMGSNAPTIFQGVEFSILGNSTLKFGSPLSEPQLEALSNIRIRFSTSSNGGSPMLYIRPARNATTISLPHLAGFKSTPGASIKISGARSIIAAYQNPDNPDQTVIDLDNGKKLIINGDYYNSNIYQQLNDGNLYISASSTNSLGNEATVFVPCYLTGSMVEMADGKTLPVEAVKIGDKVVTYDIHAQKETIRSVIWVGSGHVKKREQDKKGMFMDQEGYPVRILKGALAENVPYKDMLITPEHCLFMEGHLIPVRMLVNGKSIFYDLSISSYDYYHIELEEHSIIKVDGVLSESYLDTGNRSLFNRKSNLVYFPEKKEKSWHDDAAVCLGTKKEFVEPIFKAIQQRAEQFDVPSHIRHSVFLTYETGLYIIVGNKKILPAQYKENDSVVFMIPPGIRKIRIISRTGRPCDTIGPFVDDRRSLGVLIGKIMFVTGQQVFVLTEHLKKNSLSGWNNRENTDCRWTNGNASLKLTMNTGQNCSRFGKLFLQILAAGPYHQENYIWESRGGKKIDVA